MNALATTAHDLAGALQGKPRQNVFICRSTFGGFVSPTYIVMVDREFYEVHRFALDALQGGMTPDELGLERCPDPDFTDEEARLDRIEAASLRAHERSFRAGDM